jgi:hypothetical protein
MKCIECYWVLNTIVVYDCEDEDGNEEYDFDVKDTDTYRLIVHTYLQH